MEILTMQIRTAPKVRGVLICRNKTILTLIEANLDNFSGPTRNKLFVFFAYFPWWSNRVLFTWFGVMCWGHIGLEGFFLQGLRSMQNRSKGFLLHLIHGCNRHRQFQGIFSMGRINATNPKNCLFSLVGQWDLFTRFGSCAGVI